MDLRNGARNLHGLHDLLIRDGTHAHDHVAGHLARRLARDVRDIHAHVAALRVVAHFDAGLDELAFEAE